MKFLECFILLFSLIKSAPVGNLAKHAVSKGPKSATLPKFIIPRKGAVAYRIGNHANQFGQYVSPILQNPLGQYVSPILQHLDATSSPVESARASDSSDQESNPFGLDKDKSIKQDFFTVISNSVDDIFHKNNLEHQDVSGDWDLLNLDTMYDIDLSGYPSLGDLSVPSLNSIPNTGEEWLPTPYESEQFTEFKDLVEKSKEDSKLQETALLKSLEFDDEGKKTMLNYVFLKEQWGLTREMLEKGFDASELLKTLNSLQPEVALEMVDKIGYYGIYKHKDGFQYMDLETADSIFLLFRSCSPDITEAENIMGIYFLSGIFEISFSNDPESRAKELSKFNEQQKSIALAYMVSSKKWDIAKEMIANNYDQTILRRLLDHLPDSVAINAYKELGFYQDFNTENLEIFIRL